MRANKKRDTKPEQRLRAALFARGLRFRKHFRIDAGGVRVRPDVVFPGPRLAVFVDGCFWHGCPDHGTSPRSNPVYWEAKLKRNRSRDRDVDEALSNHGWMVMRIWEHVETGDAVEAIVDALQRRRGEHQRVRRSAVSPQ
jgi:DNA mismatch endonuclease (patch repair protein)